MTKAVFLSVLLSVLCLQSPARYLEQKNKCVLTGLNKRLSRRGVFWILLQKVELRPSPFPLLQLEASSPTLSCTPFPNLCGDDILQSQSGSCHPCTNLPVLPHSRQGKLPVELSISTTQIFFWIPEFVTRSFYCNFEPALLFALCPFHFSSPSERPCILSEPKHRNPLGYVFPNSPHHRQAP